MQKENNKWMLIFVVITMSILCLLTLSSAFAADISDNSTTNLADTNINTIEANNGDSGLNDISTSNEILNLNQSTDNVISTTNNQKTTSNTLSAINDISTSPLTATYYTQNGNTYNSKTFNNISIITSGDTYINCTFNTHVTVNAQNFDSFWGTYVPYVTFENCTFNSNDNTPVLTIYDGRVKVNNCVFNFNFINSNRIPNAIKETSDDVLTVTNNHFNGYSSEKLAISTDDSSHVLKYVEGYWDRKHYHPAYYEWVSTDNIINGNSYSYPEYILAFFYVRLSGEPAIEIESSNDTHSFSASDYYPIGNDIFAANATIKVSDLYKLFSTAGVNSGLNNKDASTNNSANINDVVTAQLILINKFLDGKNITSYTNSTFIYNYLFMVDKEMGTNYAWQYNYSEDFNKTFTASGYTVWWYVVKSQAGEWHIDGVVVPKNLLELIKQHLAIVNPINDEGYANTTSKTFKVIAKDNNGVIVLMNGTATVKVFKDNITYDIINLDVKDGISTNFTLPLRDEGLYNTSIEFNSKDSSYNVPVSYGHLKVNPYNTDIVNKSSTGKVGQKVNITTNINVNTPGYSNLVVPDGNVIITAPNGTSYSAEFKNGVIIAKDLVYPNYGENVVYTVTYTGVTNYLGSVGYITLISTQKTNINDANETGYYNQKTNITITTEHIADNSTVYYIDANGIHHNATVINDTVTFENLSYPDYGKVNNYTIYYDGNDEYASATGTITLKSLQYVTYVTGFVVNGTQGEVKNVSVFVSTPGSEINGFVTITDVFGNNYTKTVLSSNNKTTVVFENINLINVGLFDNILVTFNSSNVNYANSNNSGIIKVYGLSGIDNVTRFGYYDQKVNVTVHTTNIQENQTIGLIGLNGNTQFAKVDANGNATFTNLSYADYDGIIIYNLTYNSTNEYVNGTTGTITLKSLQYVTYVTGFVVNGTQGEVKNVSVVVSTPGSEINGFVTITDVFGNNYTKTVLSSKNETTVVFENINLINVGLFDNIPVSFNSSNVNYANSTNNGIIKVRGLSSIDNVTKYGYYDQNVDVTVTTHNIVNGSVVYIIVNGERHDATVVNDTATFYNLSYPNYGQENNYTVFYEGDSNYAPSNGTITLKSNPYKTVVWGQNISGFVGDTIVIYVNVSSEGPGVFGFVTITDVFGKNYTTDKIIYYGNGIAEFSFSNITLNQSGTFDYAINFTSTNENYLNSDNYSNILVKEPTGTFINNFESVGYYDQNVDVTVTTHNIVNGSVVYIFVNGERHDATVVNDTATFYNLSYPDYGQENNYIVFYDGDNMYTKANATIKLTSNQYNTNVTGFSIKGLKGEVRNITITISTPGSELDGILIITDSFGNQVYNATVQSNSSNVDVTFTNILLDTVGTFNYTIQFISSNVNYNSSSNIGLKIVNDVVTPVDPNPVTPEPTTEPAVPENPGSTEAPEQNSDNSEPIVPIIPDTNLAPSEENKPKSEDDDDDGGDDASDVVEPTSPDNNTPTSPGTTTGGTTTTVNPVTPNGVINTITGTTATATSSATTGVSTATILAAVNANGRDINVNAVENLDENQKVNSSAFIGDVAYNEGLGELRRREEVDESQSIKELEKEGIKIIEED